jgi:hypothetical protein
MDIAAVFIPEARAGRRAPTRAQSRRPAGSVREPARIPLLILPRRRPEFPLAGRAAKCRG